MPRKSTRPLCIAAAAALSGWLGGALAQSPPPNAGQLLEQMRPQPPALPAQTAPKRLLEAPVRPTVEMTEGVTVVPSGFRISGAVSFNDEELQALVQPWVGRKLDLAGLNEAAGAITRRYQSAGHLLSYAYLPAQRVADGVIEIAVLEGRLDAVQVVTAQDVRLHDDVVQAHIAELVDKKPLLQSDVERQLLLLNDIPGVTARGAFTPGASQGTAEIVVSVAEDDPFGIDFSADNYGNESSGLYRASMGLQFKDLFGAGDYTQARFTLTNRGSLVSGFMSTLVPVGGHGFKAGAALSSLRYQLAGDYAALGAEGNATVLGLKARQQLLRSARANIAFEANYEHKRLRDDLELIAQTNRKTSQVGSGALSFDWSDALGGLTGGAITVYAGYLELLDDIPRAADADGLQTAGRFNKGGVTLARRQALFGPLSAYLRFAGQFTRGNLDSSEKIALGGPGAVRAYAPGESIIDDGRIVNAEFRYAHEYLGGSLLWSLFYDRGWGRININPLPGTTGNDQRISGSGLGLQWNGGDYGLTASLAWRGSSRAPTAEGGDPSPRVYLQLYYAP